VGPQASPPRAADYIRVVGDGHIVEAGSRKELMKLDGLYADLYALRAKQYA